MSFANAYNTNASNSIFNDVGGHQYNFYQPIDPGLRRPLELQLQPAPMDASDRAGCLPETRVDLVRLIEDWANNKSSHQSVFWLYGLAGAGKSTLSTTIVNRFRAVGRLGAFVFFDRDVMQRNDPKFVIRTIAFQLGMFDDRIGAAVLAAIKNIPDISFLPPQLQFHKIIIEPLQSARNLNTLHRGVSNGYALPVVLVLDALDECGDPYTRRSLLAVLAQETATLAPVLRIIVTSRVQPDISSWLRGRSHIHLQELDTTSGPNTADISRYFRHRAAQTRMMNQHLPLSADWPGEGIIQMLVGRACGLFAWATTAWEFIDTAHYPEDHLKVLLNGRIGPKAEAALDALYTTALESAGDWENKTFVDDVRAILGVIITARNPLSPAAIDQLLRLPKDRPSIHTISRLGCVVSQIPVARILHPSFGDFLFDRARCGRDIWHFNATYFHRRLAICCIKRLSNGGLKRNLCNLTLSTDLKNETLSEDMKYACLFWIDHMSLVADDDMPSVMAPLNTFIRKHLLHWFEAMSILRRSKDTITLLNNLLARVTTNFSKRSSLVKFLRDAHQFAQTFGTSMEEHPLLVYFAALPFTPVDSTIYQTFHDAHLFPTIPGGFRQSPSPLLLVLTKHGGEVNSVSFSPDGMRIVSGSVDGTVRVWDVSSGMEAFPALQGHQGWVMSVTFSPDGSRIASGSCGNTICVWDALSGAEVYPPMRGHKHTVNSVTFSPDSTRIASGSDDKTIRVWDALLGLEILPALRGHEDIVWSVAFSPNGTRIVSGSRDRTIRIWDAALGNAALLTLRGHESSVRSVAFSPDGTRIVSGSDDTTIRVWDALSGVEALSTMHGHNLEVTSVTFSTDGTQIVSGSDDETIRIWNAQQGIEVPPALRGHKGTIWSVALSPDGTRIVSGSRDKTVGVWVVPHQYPSRPKTTVTHAKSPRRRPALTGEVPRITFSPDGAHVMSYSDDMTTRTWDTTTGHQIPDYILPGHPRTHPPINSNFDKVEGTNPTIIVTSNGWLVDIATNRTISKLPATIHHKYSVIASHKKSLAIGTTDGQLVIVVNIPLAAFMTSETQPVEGESRVDRIENVGNSQQGLVDQGGNRNMGESQAPEYTRISL